MKKKIAILLMMAMLFAGVGFATTFTGVVDNSFNDAGNWDGGMPGTGNYIINNNNQVVTTGTYADTGGWKLYVGYETDGYFTVNAGHDIRSNQADGIYIGNGNGVGDAYGEVHVYGTLLANGTSASIRVGNAAGNGRGLLYVHDGGLIRSQRNCYIYNGKIYFEAHALQTHAYPYYAFKVYADGIVGFETDGSDVATATGSTFNLILYAGASLEMDLTGAFDIGDSWTLFANANNMTELATFDNVISSQGYTFTQTYDAGADTFSVTLATANTLPVLPLSSRDVAPSITLEWKAGDVTADSYVVSYSTNSDMSGASSLGYTESAGIFSATPTLAAGTTYYWRVDSVVSAVTTDGAIWKFTTGAAGPAITVQPVAFTLVPKDTTPDVTLSITAIAADTYKWYKVGDPDVLVATTEDLTITGVTKADEGYYYCVASHTANPDVNDTSANGQIMTERMVVHFDFELANDIIDSESGLVGEYHTAGNIADPRELEPSEIITEPGDGVASSRCISLPNNSNQIRVPGAAEFLQLPVSARTVSAFVRVDVGTSTGTVLGNQHSSGSPGWLLQAPGTSPTPGFKVADATDIIVEASEDISNGEWHMITATFDGVNSIIYVDGIAKGVSEDNVNTIEPYDGSLLIGARKLYTPNDHFYGMIDEVKLWNYVLGPDEIIQEYANTLGKAVCSNPDAVSYDLTGDCEVNVDDLLKLAEAWLATDHLAFPSGD